MFEKENAFYRAHLPEFLKEYPDKELVIIGNQVIGVYDRLGQAVQETAKTHEPGTFCVKHVQEREEPLVCTSFWTQE
jgi:hypothetical protein